MTRKMPRSFLSRSLFSISMYMNVVNTILEFIFSHCFDPTYIIEKIYLKSWVNLRTMKVTCDMESSEEIVSSSLTLFA